MSRGSWEERPAAEGALGTECPAWSWWQLFSQLWKKKALSFPFWPLPAPAHISGLADRECACCEGSEGQAQLEGGREGTPPADSTES